MDKIQILLRFYEELNDFLTPEKRKITFLHTCARAASIKDVIESLGVPHTEIDLILVNGESVDFSYQVQADDHISVYPVFEALDISSVIRLHPQPLRMTRFILDVHLGKLARYLRLLGFDTFYDTNYDDKEIIRMAVSEKRIILTRDIGILKNNKVTHGHWMRETNPKKQVFEILKRYDLVKQCQPFTRCLECNGKMRMLDSQDKFLLNTLPQQVLAFHDEFIQCDYCKKIYWKGTHYKKLAALVELFMSS